MVLLTLPAICPVSMRPDSFCLPRHPRREHAMGRPREGHGPWKRTQKTQNAVGEMPSEKVPVPDFRQPVFEMRQEDRASGPAHPPFRAFSTGRPLESNVLPVWAQHTENAGSRHRIPSSDPFSPAFSRIFPTDLQQQPDELRLSASVEARYRSTCVWNRACSHPLL